MRFPNWISVFGNRDYRGDCPQELAEQITFFQWLRLQHPGLHRIAVHPRNEGKRTYHQARMQRLEGALNVGASDVIIPAAPAFVCEIKRRDHTKSRWQEGQQEYLKAAQDAGAFVCVALGADAAIDALQVSLEARKRHSKHTITHTSANGLLRSCQNDRLLTGGVPSRRIATYILRCTTPLTGPIKSIVRHAEKLIPGSASMCSGSWQ